MFNLIKNTNLRDTDRITRLIKNDGTPIPRFNTSLDKDNLGNISIGLEGFFGDSIDEKIAKFKQSWFERNQKIMDYWKNTTIPDITKKCKTITEDMEVARRKITAAKAEDIEKIALRNVLSYVDTQEGLVAIGEFETYLKFIFSKSPAYTDKNFVKFYNEIHTGAPPAIKETFNTYYDNKKYKLNFHPLFLFKGGPKLHVDKTAGELGYTKDKILAMLPLMTQNVEEAHKLIAMQNVYESAWESYEAYGINLIKSGQATDKTVADLYSIFFIIFEPMYDSMIQYSIRSYTGIALNAIMHICSRI